MDSVELIVDAGIIFTGLTGTGVTKALLFSRDLKLFAPEYLFDELKEHFSRIKLLSSLSSSEVDSLISKLRGRINIVEKSKFESFLDEADKLISDPDDTEYLALSFSLDNCPIWSEDQHFKRQSLVKIFTTKELVEFLKSKKLF
jgi:predicted nucleic acid-binding protein